MENSEFKVHKISVKMEPLDEDDNREPPPEEIWIKTEPFEETVEKIEVKCDPYECKVEKTEKTTDIAENAKPKRQTRQKKVETAPKAEQQKKAPARKKIRRPLTNFEDVYDSIDTITLTEEERQKEHEKTLDFLTPLEFVCKDCAMGYNTKESYDEHMKEHSVHLGSYLCELCNTHYQTSEALEEHKQSHYIRYSCSFCQSQFKQRETAGCHIIQLHKPDAMFGCCYCPRGFRRVSFLKVHEETCPNKTKTACDICQKEFKNRIQLALHKSYTDPIMLMQMDENQRSPVPVKIPPSPAIIHKNDRKKKEPLTCKICSRNYKCRASLTRHLLSHDLNVTCEECNIVFPNRLILRHHNYEAHNPQNAHKYGEKTCPHCPRVCVSSAMLKRHISRMHNDRSRKYQCDYCNRLYLTKSDVRSHISWSHLETRREHVCHCGHAFRSPTLLKRHQDRLHGVVKKNFTCSFCGEQFKYKKLLKRHLMTHPEKRLACERCGLKFQTRVEVKAHKQEHLDEPKERRNEYKVPTTVETTIEHLEVDVSPSRMAWRGHKAQRGRPPRVDQY